MPWAFIGSSLAEEQRRIVGEEVARRIALYDHDCRDRENLVALGRTSRGNEVWINRRVYEADRVILTGEIIYHQIAGYSGGRKSLVPGVAGAETTTFNHQLILDPNCRPGILEGNPAHEDLLEACRMFEPDFLLNVVLSPSGGWVRVVAGHYDLAHRAGCETVDQMCRIPIGQPYDLVLASAGGFPLDIDLRQAHKGMENAARALRPGGVLVYFAECREGTGSAAIEEMVEKIFQCPTDGTGTPFRICRGCAQGVLAGTLGRARENSARLQTPGRFGREMPPASDGRTGKRRRRGTAQAGSGGAGGVYPSCGNYSADAGGGADVRGLMPTVP